MKHEATSRFSTRAGLRSALVVAFAVALGAVAVSNPHVARAQANLQQQLNPAGEEQQKKIPLFLWLSLQTQAGVYADNPLVSFTPNVTLGYVIPVINTVVQARIGGSVEVTDNDFTSSRNEFLLSDTVLFFQRPIYMIPVLEVMMIGRLTGVFPTSKQSQYNSLIASVEPRVTFVKQMYGFTLGFAEAFRYNFYKQTTSSTATTDGGGEIYDPTNAANLALNVLDRAGFLTETGDMNTEFDFRHIAFMAYNFTDELSLNLAFFLLNGFAFTPEAGRDTVTLADGQTVAIREQGNASNARNLWGTDFSLAYGPIPNVNFAGIFVTAGVTAFVPQLGTDGKSYQNPLPFGRVDWNNSTTAYLSFQMNFDSPF